MAIVLKTISDSEEARADLAKLRTSVNSIQDSVENVSTKFANFTRLISIGLAGTAAIASYTKLADTLTDIETKIRLVTRGQDEFRFALNAVRSTANATRGDLESVASLYSRLARSSTAFGASQASVARVTSLVSKSIAMSGSGAQEANAAIQQLGQALSSGKLAGDELRSVLENAPVLAEQIAKGLGVSIGKLRALGEQGTLTSDKVFKAILKQQSEIDTNFTKVQITYGQAFRNLGTSIVILFDEVKKGFFGATGSLATVINKLADGIFNFATNFKVSLLSAKLSVLLFITDVIIGFSEFWKTLDLTNTKIGAIALKLKDSLQPVIENFLAVVSAGFILLIKKLSELDFSKIFSHFGETLKSWKPILDTFVQFIVTSFNKLRNQLPTIDVNTVFLGLKASLDVLKSWAMKAEQWFFWLYDKVIGRSWIPDLITGVISWTAKLAKGPTESISKFATSSNSAFSKIKFVGPFLAGIAAINKYKSSLLGLLGVLTTIAAILTGFALFKNGKLKIGTDDQTGGSPNITIAARTNQLLSSSIDWLKKLGKDTKESFDKSKVGKAINSTFKSTSESFATSGIGRTLKQIFGINDSNPGQMFGQTIDTRATAQVGRGPFRSDPNRTPGHDILNAFPPGWQMPIIVALTTAVGLAIVAGTQSGIARTALLSVATTLAGIFATSTVAASERSEFFAKAAFGFVSIVKKGITALFGGNVLKDPFGFLAIIAKTSLLFAAGRELIGRAALGIATAPTRAATTVTSILERNLLNRDIAKSTAKLAEAPRQLNTVLESNRRAFNDSLNSIVGQRDAAGNIITNRAARDAIRVGDTSALGTGAVQRQLVEAIRNQTALQGSRADLARLNTTLAPLQASLLASQAASTRITEALSEQRAALKEGVKFAGAGAGGLLGAVAGFQLGTEIAKGMTGLTDWARVGVAMAISFVGQAVGAGIGSILASALIGAVGLIGTGIAAAFSLAIAGIGAIIASPVLAAIALLGAILAVALNWDVLVSVFASFKSFWSEYITPILQGLTDKLSSIWAEIKSKLNLDKPKSPDGGGTMSTREVVQGTLSAAAAAAAFVAVGEKYGLFNTIATNIRKVYASNLSGLSMSFSLLKDSLAAGANNIKTSLSSTGPLSGVGQIVIEQLKIAMAYGMSKGPGAIAFGAGVGALVYNILKWIGDAIFGTDKKVVADAIKNIQAQIPTSDGNAPAGKATGGGIFGAGSGTSDSIPAMLSNGEFVVNAKDAKNNWDILTAINSGRGIQGFAKGTDLLKYDNQFFRSKKTATGKYAPELLYNTNLPDLANGIKNAQDLGFKLSKEDIDALFFNSLVENRSDFGTNTLLYRVGKDNKNQRYNDMNKSALSIINTYLKTSFKTSTELSNFLKDNEDQMSSGINRATQFSESDNPNLNNINVTAGGFGANYVFRAFLKQAEANLPTLKDIFSSGRWNGKGVVRVGNKTLANADNHALKFKDVQTSENDKIKNAFYKELAKANVSGFEKFKTDKPNSYTVPNPNKNESVDYAPPLTNLQEQVFEFLGGLGDQLRTFVKSLFSSTKMATGGVAGSGSGTSDSIPAMLSNGEFVVNAKDAQKNWGLLTAINSGMGVKQFATGTQTSVKAFDIVPPEANVSSGINTQTNEFFKNLKDKFDELFKTFKAMSPFKSLTAPTPKTTETEVPGIRSLLVNSKNLGDSLRRVGTELEKVGFKDIDNKALNELSKQSPAQILKIGELIDKANAAMDPKRGQSSVLGDLVRTINRDTAQDVYKELASILAQSKIAKVPDTFITPPPEEKPTVLKLKDQLSLINKVFPDLGLTAKELLKISDEVRENIFANAKAIEKRTEEAETKVLGTLEGPPTQRVAALEGRQKVEADRVAAQGLARSSIANIRVPFANIKTEFEKLQINISEDVYNFLDEASRAILKSYLDAAQDAKKVTETPDMPEEFRTLAQLQLKKTIDKINKLLTESFGKAVGGFESFKIDLSNVGVSVEKNIYNLLTDAERLVIESYVNEIKSRKITPQTAEATRIRLQHEVDQFGVAISDIFKTKALDYKTKGMIAGDELATSLSSGISNGLSNLLKGKAVSLEGVLKGVLDTFTSSIIDTFVKGLMDPLTGKNGAITKYIGGLGTSIYDTGSKILGSPTNPEGAPLPSGDVDSISPATVDTTVAGLWGKFTGAFKTIDFKGLFSTFTDAIGSVFKTIFSGLSSMGSNIPGLGFLFGGGAAAMSPAALAGAGMIPMATGGYVRGMGTSTSDSIPAMLSNGEFVINAKAAKANLGLLSAINSSNIKKFAAGGLATAVLSTPAMANISAADNMNSTSNQVINVNITGDISRQTRSEIYQMLPSIAEGVNSHNREKGYRR